MKKHINQKCRIASMNLYNIKKIRSHLTIDSTRTLVHALVMSHLDYCNSILYGLPTSSLNKLQRIQNMAARVVLGLKKYDSISAAFVYLHWLPIKERIDFKILLLTYKALNGQAPSYLKDLLQPRLTNYSMRSHNKILLTIPRTRTKNFGDRGFYACAPRLWNALPPEIQYASSAKIFKNKIKTFLFKRAFY